MSREIDERVVSMEFDNQQFEQGVNQTLGTLKKLDKGLAFQNAGQGFADIEEASHGVKLSGLQQAINGINDHFTLMGLMAFNTLNNIANTAVNAGIRMAKALTIDPIMSGIQEYEDRKSVV